MSHHDYIISPYLSSPLANSTKVNNIYGDERIMEAYHYYPFRKDIISRPGFNITYPTPKDTELTKGKEGSKDTTVANILNKTIKPVKTSLLPSHMEPLPGDEVQSIKSTKNDKHKDNEEPGVCSKSDEIKSKTQTPEKLAANTKRISLGSNRPVVAHKSVVGRRSNAPIKVTDNKNNGLTVEKILKIIKMTKYLQTFKKIDLDKFKELKEIDLNAFGITRQSEIRIFKEAIHKAKFDISFY